MTFNKLYPYSLVAVQLSCLLYIAVTAPVLSDNPAGLLIESAGIFLGLLSIYVVKIRNVNVAPIVKKNSELVTSGPYRIIRHPMYIAQLIAVLPLLFDYFSWLRFIAFFILLIVLTVKIQYEEKQLISHFPKYVEYSKKTNKLIPFVY